MSAQDVSDIKASISKLQQSVDALRSYSNELPNRINQSNGSSQTQALIGNLRTFLDELPTRVVNAIKAGK